jgi:protein-tyrosine phosphatase
VIDVHIHVLPAIDDGVRTLSDAVELARQAVSGGVTTVVATPHVRSDYPTTPVQMEAAVAAVNDVLSSEGIALEVLPGGELDAAWVARLSADDLQRFSFAQGGRYALLEFPYEGWPSALDAGISTLQRHGITPVLAHPERNPEVQRHPALLQQLVDGGALVQVTAASLDGRFGRSAQTTAHQLLERGLVHVLASDAHGVGLRGASIGDSAAGLHDEGLGRYLTLDAPAAMVAGEPVGPPPKSRRRRIRFLDGLRARVGG